MMKILLVVEGRDGGRELPAAAASTVRHGSFDCQGAEGGLDCD